MTSTLNRQLPAEREDPANALLDLFEHNVRALLAAGLEVQVRTRLERMMPGSAVAPTIEPQRLANDTDRKLQLAAVLTALGISERRRLSESEWRLVRGCKDWILREMKQ